MTSDGGSVTVNVAGRDVNLVALLTRLEAQMRETDAVGIRLAQTTAGPVTASQQRAANAAIQEAQAMARAAVAVGDNARAHQILVTALGSSTGASDTAVASLTAQIGRLETGGTFAAQFGNSLKSSLLGIVGPAALATGALSAVVAVVNSFAEAFTFKAELDATTASITAQLRGVRDSGEVFRDAAAFGREFKLTQQETTDAVAASIGVMRASKAPVEDILSVLARMQVLSPEQSLQEAAVALKALASGDTTSLVTRFEVGRDVANQMKAEIQGGADAVQVMSRFLNNTGIGMDVLKAKTEGVSGALKDSKLAQEQLALAQAEFAQGPGLDILRTRIEVTRDATHLLQGDITALHSVFADLGPIAGAAGALANYNEAVLGAGRSTLEWVGILGPSASEAAALAEQAERVGGAMDDERQATVQAADAVAAHAALEAQRRAEMQAGGEAASNQARMLQQSADASLLDAQAKQLEALQTQLLNEQALATANAFLAANPQINASGIQAQVTAGAITPLIGRLAELQLAIRSAKNELSGAGGGGPGLSASSFATSQQFFNKNQREAAAAAAAAQREQTLAVGTTADKMALLNRELSEAKRLYGEGSAQAIRAQTAIDQATARGTRGSRAAGATRVSDQQKFNTAMLADQERFADQSEQAEREHGRRLLEIDRDFQRRQLEQQQKNEISKRQSELDFLEAITASELNATKEGSAEVSRINERFYADQAAAQAAAQAGNLEQSERLMQLAQERADDELRRAEQIAAAQEKGQADQVARLEALREKQRQIFDEQQNQIVEGGDANVNARNEALTEEQRRFEEQQGKIATSAESAAERKVNAALRSGKAIDDENVKLREQEEIINRIGARGGNAPVAGGGVGASAGPAAPVVPTAAEGVATPETDFAIALNGLKEAIGKVETATRAAGDKVASAVQRRAVGA